MNRNELALRARQNILEQSEQENPFEKESYPLLNPTLYQFRSVQPSIYVKNYLPSKERAEEMEKQFKSLHLEHDRYQRKQYLFRNPDLQKEIQPPMRLKYRSENERIQNTINSLSLDYSGYIPEKKEKEKRNISFGKKDSWNKIPVQEHGIYRDDEDSLERKYIKKGKKKDFIGTIRSDPTILTYSQSIRTFKQNEKLKIEEPIKLKSKITHSLYNHSNNYQSLKDLKPVIKLSRYNKSRVSDSSMNYMITTPKSQLKLPHIPQKLHLIRESTLKTLEDINESPKEQKMVYFKSIPEKEEFKPKLHIDDCTAKQIVSSYFK